MQGDQKFFSALEYFAEEAVPWLERNGFRKLVAEMLLTGTPQSELQKYYETGIIDQESTPYLYMAYSRVKDPRGLVALLQSAKAHSITLIGGGPTPAELDSEASISDAVLRIRDNLLRGIQEQGTTEKIAVYSGMLHNEIDDPTRDSIFTPEGLEQLRINKGEVAVIDVIVPEFATDPISGILATLSPSHEVTYRKVGERNVVAYAWTSLPPSPPSYVFTIQLPDESLDKFGYTWFVNENGGDLSLEEAGRMLGSTAYFKCNKDAQNIEDYSSSPGLCNGPFKILKIEKT